MARASRTLSADAAKQLIGSARARAISPPSEEVLCSDLIHGNDKHLTAGAAGDTRSTPSSTLGC